MSRSWHCWPMPCSHLSDALTLSAPPRWDMYGTRMPLRHRIVKFFFTAKEFQKRRRWRWPSLPHVMGNATACVGQRYRMCWATLPHVFGVATHDAMLRNGYQALTLPVASPSLPLALPAVPRQRLSRFVQKAAPLSRETQRCGGGLSLTASAPLPSLLPAYRFRRCTIALRSAHQM